jgi:hypothetical protein
MKKIIFAFLLISLGCATTAYKTKSPKQKYFDITIKPLKTTLTVDEDIPVAVKIKNISTYTIYLPNRLEANFKVLNEKDEVELFYYDVRYSLMCISFCGKMPSGTWNAKLERVSLCPQAEICDTLLLKSFKYLMPGKYQISLSLNYVYYKKGGYLRGISEEIVKIVDK